MRNVVPFPPKSRRYSQALECQTQWSRMQTALHGSAACGGTGIVPGNNAEEPHHRSRNLKKVQIFSFGPELRSQILLKESTSERQDKGGAVICWTWTFCQTLCQHGSTAHLSGLPQQKWTSRTGFLLWMLE